MTWGEENKQVQNTWNSNRRRCWGVLQREDFSSGWSEHIQMESARRKKENWEYEAVPAACTQCAIGASTWGVPLALSLTYQYLHVKDTMRGKKTYFLHECVHKSPLEVHETLPKLDVKSCCLWYLRVCLGAPGIISQAVDALRHRFKGCKGFFLQKLPVTCVVQMFTGKLRYFYIFYPLRILRDKQHSALFWVEAFSTSWFVFVFVV